MICCLVNLSKDCSTKNKFQKHSDSFPSFLIRVLDDVKKPSLPGSKNLNKEQVNHSATTGIDFAGGLLSENTFCVRMATVCLSGFRATLVALFVWNHWLREFPLSATANGFELQCQSKVTDAICVTTSVFLRPFGILVKSQLGFMTYLSDMEQRV